MSVLYRDG